MDTVAFLLYFTNTPENKILNRPLRGYEAHPFTQPITWYVHKMYNTTSLPFCFAYIQYPCFLFLCLFVFLFHKKKNKSREKLRSRSKFLVFDELSSFRIPKSSFLVSLSAHVVLKSCRFVCLSSWISRF